MSAVIDINPHLKIAKVLDIIEPPRSLRELPIWLIWRYEKQEGKKKPLKVPYYAAGGRRVGVQGRPEDRAQLVNFTTAQAAVAKRKFQGVGLTPLDGEFTILDFDNCVVDGNLSRDIEIMAAGTYAEYSPSGNGVHIFVRGNMTGNNKSLSTNEQFGIEAFSTKGFVTFTGRPLEITQLTGSEDLIVEPGKELTDLVRLRFGDPADVFQGSDTLQEPLGIAVDTIQEALDVLDNEMHYDHWLQIGMAIHHETRGEGFEIWDEWSRKSSKYSTTEYNQARWDSFGRNPSRQVTMRSVIQLANQCGARIAVNAVSLEEFENLNTDIAADNFKPSDDLPDASAKVKASMRFQSVSWQDFSVQLTYAYLIKGLLPKAALGVLYGESGSGKSFLALDFAFAIARGIPWRGLRTRQHKVVYLAAEGATGFKNRLRAYASHHNIDHQEDIPLRIIDAAPNFLLKDDALDICKAALEGTGRPGLIVIDTFAQVLAGANENASDDMGKALANCKGIHKATGALVLLIHHSGKDSSRGARGWSGLRAAADVELEVSRYKESRVVRTTKQKDGADYQEWGFSLKKVIVGIDEDTDEVSSCVVEECELPVQKPNRGANEQAIIDALGELILGSDGGVDRDDLLNCALNSFPDDPKQSQRRKNLGRALTKLANNDEQTILINHAGKIEFCAGVTVS